ncbi:hypothetical protein RAS1_44070 [Phycisphaerae bacterium RAS1]|nr:hypothetical protein RAS1_44070 [Phycisphaerae bacterium RAS1]
MSSDDQQRSDDHQPDFDPALLDLHLGRLSPPEADALRIRILSDRNLSQQSAALAEVFAALQSHAPQPPADLAQRIAARIAAAPVLKVARADDRAVESLEREPHRIFRFGSMRDILAAAAAIVFIVGVGIPGVLSVRERNMRIDCSRNLQLLGQGVQQYASVFNSSLPFAGWNPSWSWRRSDDPSVQTQPNRRHMYKLLAGSTVNDPRLFICPARDHVPMRKDDIARRTDFAESKNISYAYFNMAGRRPTLADDPSLPILSDDNPLFDDGLPLYDLRRYTLSDAAQANSRAHRGVGQNVLSLDGHVRFMTSPNVGVAGDNIWTLSNVADYTGHEGPQSATDAQLLK